jgi:hypothetical protein
LIWTLSERWASTSSANSRSSLMEHDRFFRRQSEHLEESEDTQQMTPAKRQESQGVWEHMGNHFPRQELHEGHSRKPSTSYEEMRRKLLGRDWNSG